MCLTTLEASLKEGIFPATKTARQIGQLFPEGYRAQRKEQAKNVSKECSLFLIHTICPIDMAYQIYSGFADFLQVLSIVQLSGGL